MARGKNEVSVDLAGDASSLEKAFKRAQDASDKTEKAFDGVSSAADKVDGSFGRIGKSTEKYGSGIDRVGESADNAETRFTGLASGIDGVTTLMADPSPQEFAQGIADMADGIANAAVPALKSFGDRLKGVFENIKGAGMKSALMGTGLALGAVGLAVGAAGIAWNAYQKTQEKARERVKDLTSAIKDQANGVDDAIETSMRATLSNSKVGDSLKELGADWDVLIQGLQDSPRVFEELDNNMGLIASKGRTAAEVFDRAGIESSALTAELVRLIDESELTGGAKADLIEVLDGEADRFQEASAEADANANAMVTVKDASTATAEAIKGVNDALRAQHDPVFAAMSAMDDLAKANADVTAKELELIAAINEHGPASAEAMAAQQALTDAHVAAGEAAIGQESAMLEMAQAMLDSGSSVEDTIAHLQGLANQGQISQATVDTLSGKLRAIPSNVSTTLHAYDLASSTVESVRRNISSLPSEVVVNIRAQADANRFQASRNLYTGGVVYAAGGFPGGPRGSDTIPAWLTPGEMVLNKGQQSKLFAMLDGRGGGAGSTYNVYVQGSIRSDDDLVNVIATAQRNGRLK